MKWKAFAILFVILVSLLPVYMINKFLQKVIQPRRSLGKLILYLFSGLILVFVYTFLLVLIIKKFFPGA